MRDAGVAKAWAKGSITVFLCLCFAASTLTAFAASQNPKQSTAAPSAESKVWAAYGIHSDDLDGMVKRRNIRALVMLNPIGFFYDNGQPMGIMYEALRDFEAFVNQKLKTGPLKVEVTFIPVRPDQVEDALLQGAGDLVAYALVITPERQQKVAFTVPIEKNVKQVIVSGANFGSVSSVEDLGGKEIYVNPLAAYYQTLQQLNDKLKQARKPLIKLKAADEHLDEDDLIQMVSAGLIPATVTTDQRAKLWSEVLPHLTMHSDLVIASGEKTAWAVRKDSPQLKQLLDEFLAPRALGTSFGNTLVRRYLQNTKWVVNSTSPEQIKKFEALSAVFKKYADQYNFDYLMIMAQGYQESMLEQSMRGDGTVGIMQVNPHDAAAPPIEVPDVWNVEGNILAGVKMLRNIEDRYLNDPKLDPQNKTLLAFASYNAGPNRIAWLRQQARKDGLNPDVWFDNVELEVAKNVGQVTVTYVGNIYKYYVAYKMALASGAAKSD
jgi:membrane-bound lytic murein transglycosylase MltF